MISKALGFISDVPHRYGRVTHGRSVIQEIDGLRFLAIMPVLFWHASLRGLRDEFGTFAYRDLAPDWFFLIPAGKGGVLLFFAISGFILATPWITGRPPTIRSFYMRRLTRLEPPYILVMLGAFVLLQFASPGNVGRYHESDVSNLQSLLASLIYAHGLIFQADPQLNPPAWSLEIEFQFYVLMPFVMTFILLIYNIKSRLMVIISAIILLASISIFSQVFISKHNLYFYTVAFYAHAFLCGIFCAQTYFGHEDTKSSTVNPLFSAAAILLYALSCAQFLWFGANEKAIILVPLQIISAIFIIHCALRPGFLQTFLQLPWIRFVGGACYSIYLTHVILMQGLSQIVLSRIPLDTAAAHVLVYCSTLVPISIVAGLIFYVMIERPFMGIRVSGLRTRK